MVSKHSAHYNETDVANGYTFYVFRRCMRTALLWYHRFISRARFYHRKSKLDGVEYAACRAVAQWLFQIIKVTVRCNDRGSRRSSPRNLLFGSFFLLQRGKEVALSTLTFTTDIKGQPSDKGRQLSAALGTCNPSFVLREIAGRFVAIQRDREWTANLLTRYFPSADVSDKKKSAPYKAREDGHRCET